MPRTAEYLERGRTFGRWTVLADLPHREHGGHKLYRCRCQCGTYRTVRGASLRSGVSTSCGQWCGRDADAMRELARGVAPVAVAAWEAGTSPNQ
jgi:hypothetical protein